MSLLYHRIAFDYEFIKASLASVITNDPFTEKLLEFYTIVRNSGALAQPVVLTIQRADYMFHKSTKDGSLSLKQVEVNNIASSFAGLDSKVTELHVEMLRQMRLPTEDIKRVPENRALYTVAQGLVEAWKYYNNVRSYILFVVEKENRNIIDQRLIEYEMFRQTQSKIHVLYLTLAQCLEELYIDCNGKLVRKGTNDEIAIVYYRAGYMPQHYSGDDEWRARLMLEQSAAIKCPWIGAHLAGTKKIQQVLSDEKVLEKFVADPKTRQRIAETFVGLYSLEKKSPNTVKIVNEACNKPDKYVLKPQLEGGGNNFYGDQVREKLHSLTPEQREAYILMDRILPVEHENVLVRANETVELNKVVSEFGTFGVLLGSVDKVLSNQSGGHLLRTKGVNTDEGGVMAGASVLDSPYLV